MATILGGISRNALATGSCEGSTSKPGLARGGGLRGGTVVGRTNARAEFPIERPLMPHDLLATVYDVMGINPTLSFPDHSGRPVPILTEGSPIREIL